MPNDKKKFAVVGDEKCGKYSLICNLFTDDMPDPSVPTVYKEYITDIEVDNQKVPVEIWITPSQDHYSLIRTQSYENIEAAILCFDVSDPTSLENAINKWSPEIREYRPTASIILVATKTDLRPESGKSEGEPKIVTTEVGKEAADAIKATEYIECSAKTGVNVKNVFKAAAKAALKIT